MLPLQVKKKSHVAAAEENLIGSKQSVFQKYTLFFLSLNSVIEYVLSKEKGIFLYNPLASYPF